MEKRIVRIVLNEELFRKYKVFCAIADKSMTDMTNEVIKDFIEQQQQVIKIIKVEVK